MEKLQQKYTSITSIYITHFGLQPYRYYSGIVNGQQTTIFQRGGILSRTLYCVLAGKDFVRLPELHLINRSGGGSVSAEIEKSDNRKDCALLLSPYIMHLRAHDLGHPNAHAYIIIDDTYFTTTVIMRITVIGRRAESSSRGVLQNTIIIIMCTVRCAYTRVRIILYCNIFFRITYYSRYNARVHNNSA